MINELPRELEPLGPLFDEFGGLWFAHEIEARADNLSAEELGGSAG